MHETEVLDEVEERGCKSSLLSTFEEIALTFLDSVTDDRGDGQAFTFLQDYLDGFLLIDGISCRRRTVLLEVHDLKENLEAPPGLQSATLARLRLLHLRPAPEVRFYQDIATALLRMEVVIRLEAMQALAEPEAEAADGLAEAIEAAPRRRRRTVFRLKTVGYGLAAAACCAGTIMVLNAFYGGDLEARAPAELAAKGEDARAHTAVQSSDPDRVLSSNDGSGEHPDMGACGPATSPGCDGQNSVTNTNNAAELETKPAFPEEGSSTSASSGLDSAVSATAQTAAWSTSVEAQHIAKPASARKMR